jgi:uncharacterized protein
MYARSDPRVVGLVLLNPWVRTTEGQARALIKHYYVRRIMSVEFWRKLLGGGFGWSKAVDDLRANVKLAARERDDTASEVPRDYGRNPDAAMPLPGRMASALKSFRGRILLVLSGNDLTAQEFRDAVAASEQWQRITASSSVVQREIVEANHTFATRAWRDTVASWTTEWVLALSRGRTEANVSATAQPSAPSPSSARPALRANGRAHP